jgi:hypothetical protein
MHLQGGMGEVISAVIREMHICGAAKAATALARPLLYPTAVFWPEKTNADSHVFFVFF